MKDEHGPKCSQGTFDQVSEGMGHFSGGNSMHEASAHFSAEINGTAYADMSDDQLYRLARELDIPKRSCLSREALIKAIRDAQSR